ncbi:MAG: hypothetical protein HC799_07095 [Limnothrix sp. RL_2_0]|nr:hypothetical protein [Limnothrix sp. RL_2_0]
MSFSQYKNIAEVQREFEVRYLENIFIVSTELEPSKSFLGDFEFSKQNIDVFSSEAARSEVVISPLLREVYKQHYQDYAFWIQKSIRYDDELSGTPDYLFSRRSPLGKTVLEPPLVVVVEAKKNDFEQGWGQCLAELVAAQKINGDRHRTIYGIVTDGNLWQFGKLYDDVFTQHPENFTIDRIERVYGALEAIMQLVEQEDQKKMEK